MLTVAVELPVLHFKDMEEAMAWLEKTFGPTSEATKEHHQASVKYFSNPKIGRIRVRHGLAIGCPEL